MIECAYISLISGALNGSVNMSDTIKVIRITHTNKNSLPFTVKDCDTESTHSKVSVLSN